MNQLSDRERTKRKEKELKFRHSEILQEAEKIFAAKGFYNTTIAEIAQASGFAVGTPYQFFQSKEKLYMAMVVEKMALMYAGMTAAAEQENTIEKLRAIIRAHFQFVENNLDFCNLFFGWDTASLSDGHTYLRNRMFEEYVNHAQYIEVILVEGMDKNILRKLNPRIMSFALSWMIRGVIFNWMTTTRDEPLTEKVSLVLDIILHGVFDREGVNERNGLSA